MLCWGMSAGYAKNLLEKCAAAAAAQGPLSESGSKSLTYVHCFWGMFVLTLVLADGLDCCLYKAKK